MEAFTFPINQFSPVEEQIYVQLKRIISNNDVAANLIFPEPKDLAIHLKQSQSDVVNAYNQLVIEGYLEKTERGFVMPVLSKPFIPSTGYKSTFQELENNIMYDYALNVVDKEFFPLEKWHKSLHITDFDSDIYTEANCTGELRLKKALQMHFKKERNLEVQPANIMISSSIGSLIYSFAMFLKNKGFYEHFISENPSFAGTYNVFDFLNYHLEIFTVTKEGYQLDHLPERRTILFITPSQHQPFGLTMPLEQRLQLLEWAKRTDSLIIEDDHDSEFRYNARSIAPLASMDSERVIYVNSFSRSFLPTIHVAYMFIPDRYVEEFSIFLQHFPQSASSSPQLSLAHFIEQGYFSAHLKKMTTIYDQKMAVLTTKIQTTFPEQAKVYSDKSGQFLIVQPHNGMSEQELIQTAKEHSVRVYPLSECYLEGTRPTSPIVLLGFGTMNRIETVEGIDRLLNAWY